MLSRVLMILFRRWWRVAESLNAKSGSELAFAHKRYILKVRDVLLDGRVMLFVSIFIYLDILG